MEQRTKQVPGPYVYPELHLFVAGRLMYSGNLTVSTELGRQNDTETTPVYKPQRQLGGVRISIAEKQMTEMSRHLLVLTPLSHELIRIENKGKQLIRLGNGDSLRPQQQLELHPPIELTVFDRRVQISPPSREEASLVSMKDPVLPPDAVRETMEFSGPLPLPQALNQQESTQLIRWLQGVTTVLQSAIGSTDFSERAVQEMVELIGLDSGRILEISEDGDWTVSAQFQRPMAIGVPWVPVRDLLRRVVNEKKTSWTTPLDLQLDTSSRLGLLAAVAAPILNREGEVIAALYGDRRKEGEMVDELIGPMEAMLVETLARSIAAGRSRLDRERHATALQVRFEQFFTPELSRQLTLNPDLLTRRDTDVTILFCDIRKFSAISEDRGPDITMNWLSDVMGAMADCAAQFDGALIDYIGDELMFMWGAPVEQPDHATRAAHAALAMASRCVALDKKWRDQLGHTTNIGIGINTGNAHVGNVGFQRKFRYAPFGNTVNLASRVQGATKYLGVKVIATASAFSQLRTKVPSRRLCSVRVINIEQPVVLYELCDENAPGIDPLCEKYEAALASFEKQDFPIAIRILSEILRGHPNDGPTLLLLSRAVAALMNRDAEFTSVFELSGK